MDKRRRASVIGLRSAIIALAGAALLGAAAPAPCASSGGTVAGIVRLAGEAPKPAPIKIVRDRDVCKNVTDESLIVGPDHAVEYAVITAATTAKQPAAEPEGGPVYRLDNSGCRFVPHVLAMQVNQFVELVNSDPILHTAHALFFTGQPQFNVALWPGRVVRKPMVTPGVVKVVCEVHPWMYAYIVVAQQPYFAVTDIHGRYEIRGLPPGPVRLKLWHERLGSEEKTVEVQSGKTTVADFTFSPAEGAPR
ncbi:MAG TPA: carboxypeptidase regulatory-like domain-containing protein [Candidatus Binataceae bacterium]|nr:carboxypeptidase regulatory-like domain-containing protein [Candidatus Binataceae bacterium]